jgi:hypothetical protein
MTDVTPNDTEDAIAELLLEAAALANAATTKLEEALRLAEQAKGEKLEAPPLTEDWAYFRENADRAYHCRLASPAELERIEEQGMTLAPDCFVFCIARIWRDVTPHAMRQLFVALPRLEDSELECRAVWHGAMDRLLFARDAWAFI